ncbi:MAG TPA: aldo/keto reductase [Candidatus Binatia bacterium]|nr:aldo/keto reductase [Candidatus Binatia bacterium]
MEYTILGRSGLQVSIVGLGCGGHSRLGQATGKSEQESIAIVRQAVDLGITLFDTAEVYGTEGIVGKALETVSRDQVVIATKKLPPAANHPDAAGELKRGLEQSLRRLRTDYVDIYFLHGVRPEQYRFAYDVLAPVLLQLREAGKIRAVGITEAFSVDPGHQMLQQAVEAECWEVMMVGFSLLNPSARSRVFQTTLEKNIGVLCMFAVRRALSQPAQLRALIADLKQKGQIDPGACDAEDPLGFLTQEGKAATLPEAAYRYCRHEAGIDVVLTGTGNVEHLKANVASLLKPPLVQADLQRLKKIFGNVDSVSGN